MHLLQMACQKRNAEEPFTSKKLPGWLLNLLKNKKRKLDEVLAA